MRELRSLVIDPQDAITYQLDRVVRVHSEARRSGRPFFLVVPGACECGRTLELDLSARFDRVMRMESARGPSLSFESGDRRLEYRVSVEAADDVGLEGTHAPGLALVELEIEPDLPLQGQLFREDGALQGSHAWASWTIGCGHGKPVPILPLGQRAIPGWCARPRFEGEASLLDEPAWPGVEACHACRWHRGSTELSVFCAAPGVELERSGLCLEVDVYHRDGRKRRGFVALEGDVAEGVRALMRRRGPRALPKSGEEADGTPSIPTDPAVHDATQTGGASVGNRQSTPGSIRPAVVDVKFVAGEAAMLDAESDAFMERWRFYWNGEAQVRKPPGSPLHDWNKWGRELEFLSVAEPGGMPPAGGWPPVLDLPEGPYLLRVVELRWAVGRRSEAELEWVLRVLEGPHRGRRVFRRAPVRTPAMEALVIRDISIVLSRKEAEIERPGQPGFEQVLKQVRGVAVIGRVAKKDAFTNLYLDSRATTR